MSSPLYRIFEAENTPIYGMTLKPTGAADGGDADELNTVWVHDTAAFPFYDGEVYHQAHCNFFMSEGMPYPDEWTETVWDAKRASGEWAATGCPGGQHGKCYSLTNFGR